MALVNPDYNGKNRDVLYVSITIIAVILFAMSVSVLSESTLDHHIAAVTPFKELLQAHQDYWLQVIDRDKQRIPDLEVYIINVHPSRGDTIQEDDHDAVKDRINDIMYGDSNSHYDENLVYAAIDYIKIIGKLEDLAISYIGADKIDVFKNEFEKFLKTTEAKSKSNTNENRKYNDLLNGSFKLTNVIRIEPSGYDNNISGKGADFTSKSIKDLIKQGKRMYRGCLIV